MNTIIARTTDIARTLQPELRVGIGIFTGQTRANSGIDVAAEYSGILDMAVAADALGFDSFWLSEHHGANDNYMPSVLPMAAAIASVTGRIAIGTAILIPAFCHPLRLAEDVAVIDQLSRGRFILGLGLGWREDEFAMFDVPLAQRTGRTVEMIGLLRRLWRGEEVTVDGPYYRMTKALCRPLPYRDGGPAILLAGSQEKPIRRAAGLADGLIYSVTGPTAAAVQPDLQHVHDALAAADDARATIEGSAPFPVTLLLNAFVHETDCWHVIGACVDHQYVAYAAWKASQTGSEFSDDAAARAADAGRKLVIAGHPVDVAPRLAAWVAAIAPQRPLHLVIKLHYPGLAPSRTIAAMELFQTDVLPALKNAAGVSGGPDRVFSQGLSR